MWESLWYLSGEVKNSSWKFFGAEKNDTFTTLSEHSQTCLNGQSTYEIINTGVWWPSLKLAVLPKLHIFAHHKTCQGVNLQFGLVLWWQDSECLPRDGVKVRKRYVPSTGDLFPTSTSKWGCSVFEQAVLEIRSQESLFHAATAQRLSAFIFYIIK